MAAKKADELLYLNKTVFLDVVTMELITLQCNAYLHKFGFTMQP